jgi:hypothetical protein
VRAALLAYKEVHGDLQVPKAFVVPSEAPWSEEAWGMKLGGRVDGIRSQEHYVKDHPERRAELDALGFRWRALAFLPLFVSSRPRPIHICCNVLWAQRGRQYMTSNDKHFRTRSVRSEPPTEVNAPWQTKLCVHPPSVA